jgi:hypothetical protein
MKNVRTPMMAVLLMMMIFSCRKKDITSTLSQNNPNAVAKHTDGVNESGWQSTKEWVGVEQPQYSIFFTNIKAAAITAEASEKGMVRVFKINDSGTSESTTLPFEETIGSAKYYWYYQITEGNIMISVDVYGSKINPAEKSLFKYVILSNDVVDGFEKKGTSKSDLMSMSYQRLTEATKN